MTASWSIVSTMHGVPEAVLPCIAHHLQSRAEYLHIYLDAPNPVVQSALAAHPRCRVTVCDEAYWIVNNGHRPNGLVARQMANLAHARQQSRSEWLVHLDSDEFLVDAESNSPPALEEQLSRLPAGQDWARIMPMERILPAESEQHSIFDGVFRGQIPDKSLVKNIYGRGAAHLRHGLSGHVRGKIAFRRKTRQKVRLHDVVLRQAADPRQNDETESVALAPHSILSDAVLLHFEGWSRLQWISKLLRFAETGQFNGHNSGRRASVRFMAENTDPETRLGLFDMVLRVSNRELENLEKAGAARNRPFDPAPVARACFPDIDFDFRVDAFDARLRANNPDFFSRHGL